MSANSCSVTVIAVRCHWYTLIRAQPGDPRAGQGLLMSADGHGFESGGDPRFRTRKAAAEAQRAFDAARVASEPDDARAERDRLVADDDASIERALTAARRARSSP